VAIARIARDGGVRMLDENVLWYHARYVSPGWGRRLARASQIGSHIFYRP
jgi:spore germination cell wall hydrolase CwlJ-like protein